MRLQLREARRAPGSEWLKNHPRALEVLYTASRHLFTALYPLLKRLAPRVGERLMIRSEEVIKGWVFNCQMCGQCILHSTGMTCPMNCPKHIRNGPCGGVRSNGHCEVLPDMPCVWVQAWDRSQRMPVYGVALRVVQPPVNRSLEQTSAWINLAEGRDVRTPRGWTSAASGAMAGHVR